jgi:chromatin remodeling complex protein RSC6
MTNNTTTTTNVTQTSCDLFEQFGDILSGLNLVKTQVSTLQLQIKNVEKAMRKQVKVLEKDAAKGKNRGNRQPSGFARPIKVTKELCEFMNRAEGTEIARTDVTKALIAYIKENKLENKANSQIISPDDNLIHLLGIEPDHELTYFNIQKYMNKHFVKTITI